MLGESSGDEVFTATGPVMPDKYQQEIEDILEAAGESAPERGSPEQPPEDRPRLPRVREVPNRPDAGASGRVLPSLSSGKILLAGIVIFVIAALLNFGVVMWVGLAMLVAGYVLSFTYKPRPVMEKRWRGQPLETGGGGSAWDRIRRWMGR